jgi:flavin-binding protein dodecin
MPDKTYKKIEIVGVSENSISEAIGNALTKASETVRNIDWFEVVGTRGYVKGTKPVFQVELKIGFRIE